MALYKFLLVTVVASPKCLIAADCHRVLENEIEKTKGNKAFQAGLNIR